MAQVFDDKSEICISFLLEQLERHWQGSPNAASTPFFLGMNGVQGVGKTTLVKAIANTLRSPPYSLPTIVLSIDDLYLPHDGLVELASSHPDNPLIQHRGQPSTHDVSLGTLTLSSIRRGGPTKIPQFDKSCFQGQGDRVSEDQWETVNMEEEPKIKVVIFEGWCVGFRSIGEEEVKRRWHEAVFSRGNGAYDGRLGWNRAEDVLFVDRALEGYTNMTTQFDAFIHIDAENIRYVYDWRLEQEVELRAIKGAGMTNEQVHKFVDGYYSSYELYTEGLRNGVFMGADSEPKGRQLRLIVGRDRKVREVKRI